MKTIITDIRERHIVLSSYKLKKFFFTKDHCQSLNSKIDFDYSTFVPITFYLPQVVVPRASLPTGVVDTLEKYIMIFHDDEILIDNPDPLFSVIAEEVKS